MRTFAEDRDDGERPQAYDVLDERSPREQEMAARILAKRSEYLLGVATGAIPGDAEDWRAIRKWNEDHPDHAYPVKE